MDSALVRAKPVLSPALPESCETKELVWILFPAHFLRCAYPSVNVVAVDTVAANFGGLGQALLHEVDDVGSAGVDPPLRIAVVVVAYGILGEAGVVGFGLLNGAEIDIADDRVVNASRRGFLQKD